MPDLENVRITEPNGDTIETSFADIFRRLCGHAIQNPGKTIEVDGNIHDEISVWTFKFELTVKGKFDA